MTKHCSFSMISESRAGSSKKSKNRYDRLLPGSRVAAWTSNFRRDMLRGREKERKRVGGERCRSFPIFI